MNGGQIPIAPASKYLGDRQGIYTPDEVAVVSTGGVTGAAEMAVTEASKALGLSHVRFQGITFDTGTELIPVNDGSVSRVERDSLILSFSKSLSREVGERLGKNTVVEISDAPKLARLLSEQIGVPARLERVLYARQWISSLENYAFPKLGDLPAGSITAADIITVLTPIWQQIPETARQVRNRICAILDYAHAKGWRSREAPSGNGSLKAGRGLPRQVKARENRKAMPYVALPSFISALRRKPSFGRLALELLILTGTRSQEVRLATWSEFDLQGRLWTVPAEHMKRGKAHIVPLSDVALEVLSKASALRLAGTDVVFPGVAGNPMSDMTLLKVLRDMNEPFHVHGFRSTLTDWAANEGFPDAVVEAALAHKTPDAVQAAYRRTTYLGVPGQPGARVKLMEAWGRFCASGSADGAQVVALVPKKAV